MVLTKIFGLASSIAGILLIISFPSITDYMPEDFARAGIFIGIILLALGIYLLKV